MAVIEMNELDKELKKIQLRREQLALERDELAFAKERTRRRLKEELLAGPVGVVSTSIRITIGLVTGIRLFIKRWFKLLMLCITFVASILGGMAWKKHLEYESQIAEQQRRYSAEEAFVLKVCGSECVGNGSVRDTFACDAQNLDRYFPCRSDARQRFAIEWKSAK